MVEMLDKMVSKESEPYSKKFERFEAGQPAWLFPLRKAGMARFAELGFPTIKDEDWRFTNVSPISKLPFHPVFGLERDGLDAQAVAGFTFGALPGVRLVFVNGHFVAGLSTPVTTGGFTAMSLAEALSKDPGLLEKHLGRYAQGEHNAFTSLNTAFFQDGAFIHVPAGRKVEPTIQLLFVATADQSGAVAHPRNLVLAEKDSQLTLVESFVSLVDAQYWTNAVTEVVVGEGARVEHCKFQDESRKAFHIAAIHAQLGRACNFISHSIATGARLSRNNIRTVLNGEGLECILNGLYLTHGDQLADHHMVVEHAQPHCASHEYYNGILDGKSKGVFHGRILVRQAAQKTDAKQTNKNLLLSEDATVDTKPQLEIYADDVKCTHGATIGQLNDESIFYLRSRGIGSDTARRMLIHAFAGEIIERIRHPAVREELDKLVWDRLEQNPHVGEHK
jgi:Fe-S cluster assembly protein SufD